MGIVGPDKPVVLRYPSPLLMLQKKGAFSSVRGMLQYTSPHFPRPENAAVNLPVRLTVHYVRELFMSRKA